MTKPNWIIMSDAWTVFCLNCGAISSVVIDEEDDITCPVMSETPCHECGQPYLNYVADEECYQTLVDIHLGVEEEH